mgnify:CR=1 FL=1
MTSKIEARRFSGKPGTWSHCAMAVKAHIAIDDLSDYFNDGTTVADNAKASWKKAQLKIFQLFILTCDDRAATVLESVDDSQDGAGWAAYVALRDKFSNAKRAQLSKQIKKFFKRKQAAGESAADYLSDMKAKLAAIDKYPAEKIWEIMKSTTVVQNLRDDPDTEITKKLVSNRMAEAETDGKTLPYEQIESIIENDQAEADEKTPKPRKDDTSDLASSFAMLSFVSFCESSFVSPPALGSSAPSRGAAAVARVAASLARAHFLEDVVPKLASGGSHASL